MVGILEKEPSESYEIVKVDAETFQSYQREILDVERELIENSSTAYLMDEEDEMEFMIDALNQGGLAYLVMRDGKISGFVVLGPLADGSELPESVTHNFPIEECLQIKMMYVKDPGRGIGSDLMNKLINDLDREKWRHLFVRTWTKPANEGAIKFYTQKHGFKPIEGSEVPATKTKLDGSGTFEIERQYFSKEV